MKWPLASVVLCMVAGIVAGDVWGWHWWVAIFCFAGLALEFFCGKQARAISVGALFLFAGWSNVVWNKEVFSLEDLRVFLGKEPQLVTIEGTLKEAPKERFVQARQGTATNFSSFVEVERIQLHGEWREADGLVFVQTGAAPSVDLYAGRMVQVYGVIQRPMPEAVPGEFDMQEHTARRGIHYQMYAGKMTDWKLSGAENRKGLPARFRAWAMGQLQASLPAGDDNVMLLQAMGLGWKAGLQPEDADPFVKSGTLHLFAISGLHVALIAVMLVELLRGLGIPRRVCGGVLIPLLWFYTIATGWQASAVRSAIMMTVIGVGWMLERPSNLLNSLAAAALIILMLDPQQLFQPGFQLSFMVVLVMGLLVPPIEEWRQKFFRPDPLLPEELRPRWQRWLDWPVRFVTMNLVASFAAWAGSLPLIAHYFHLITPVSLLANLVLVPLSSLALMSSFGSLLMAWCPPIADLFNHGAWQLMDWMVVSSRWFAAWPWAWFPVLKPGAGVFISFYGLVLTLFALEWKSLWRWRIAVVSGVVLASLLVVGWREHQESIRLTVLDVNGGDAHVFEGGRHHPQLVIDAGDAAGYEHALKGFLLSRAIRTVPDLLVTHGDVRHVGGASALIADQKVKRLITSPVASRSPGYRQLLKEWTAAGNPHLVVTDGSTLGPWRVLHPAVHDKFASGDDNAVVLYAELRGIRVLLLSDLGRAGQKALLERHEELRADIVVAGIPAKDEPLMDELLAKIKPQVVIVTCAHRPATEQARPELRERLKVGPWTCYYLSERGSVTIDFQDNQCEVQTIRMEERIIIRPRDPSFANDAMKPGD
ncbi:MAG TPA: ComEC/Rec2 family competence protein [Verrucomicrobiae bacterium]